MTIAKSRHIPVEIESRVYDRPVWRELGLTDWEYSRIVEVLGREPNWTELGMYSVLWSEHCAYKHSRLLFRLFPTQGQRILQGVGENAGVVDVGDGLAVTFKVESHNHPSAVEPYHGAATGVGGIVRDILAMGARPIALLTSLRFGRLQEAKTRRLIEGVVAGSADYGRGSGVPVVGGEIGFDPSFQENPLVNVMAIGVVPHDRVVTAAAKGPGNPVMVIGAATGREGIAGASFASAELEGETEQPVLPTGDPEKGRRLIEACLELIESGVVVGIQDMGAAGLTSSSSEMAARAGTGIEIDLLAVPRAEPGMTPFELMLSETQERMLIVAQKGTEGKVQEIARKWGLEAAVIGRVTEDKMLRLYEGEEVVAEVPAATLTTDGAPAYRPEEQEPQYLRELASLPLPRDLRGDVTSELVALLKEPNIAEKGWIYRQFDATAQDRVAVGPGAADAAVIRLGARGKGLAATVDCNSLHCYIDPYTGAAAAVAEAARNLVCTGARPLALADGMNFGNPEKPEVYWQFHQAVRGIADAARALDTPVVGGNVSFYNEAEGVAVYPTPIIGMVGLIDDADGAVTQGFKQVGDVILILGEELTGDPRALGGSRYLASLHGLVKGPLPELDFEKERKVQDVCLEAIEAGLVASAHDVSEGGLAVALAEAALAGGLGVSCSLTLAERPDARLDAALFGEAYSRIILSARPWAAEAIIQLAQARGIPCVRAGEVVANGRGFRLTVSRGGEAGTVTATIDAPLSQLSRAWYGGIAGWMDDEAERDDGGAVEAGEAGDEGATGLEEES